MFLRSVPFVSPAIFILVGCAAPVGPKAVSPASVTARPEGRLSLEVLLLKPEGGVKSLGRGDALHAGDQYNLRVQADRPAYVNVLLAGSDGQRTLLSQQSKTAAPIPPGTPTVIPESDPLTFGKGGQERVFVIASPMPLTAAQVQAQVALAHEASAEDVRNPPPISGPSTRPGEPQKLQLASFDRDGIATLWFALTR